VATTIKSALRAVIIVFVASIGTHAASAQSATSPIDPKLIGSTVESLAQVIQQEYFDVAATDLGADLVAYIFGRRGIGVPSSRAP
jgi:hypothetical protein